MKTILHVIDTTGPGGAETVFIELADRLRARGYRSIPVIRGQGWVHDTLVARGLSPIVIDAKGSFNVLFLKRLVELIRREKVDIIQSHLLGSNVYCALAGWLTRTPVVGTFHGMVDINPDERFRAAKLWIMERGIRRFVAVSQNLSDAVAAEGLLNPAKTSVIYNGVDVDRYGGAKVGDLKARLGLPAEAIIAVSIGNVRPAKGYDILIDAAARLVEQHQNLHFVIGGHIKESLMARLGQQMAALGVADRMHFLGFSDDPAGLLREADLFVLSSTSEGFSISTVEALASGLPMVVTRCGGPEEIVTANQNAIMVEPASSEALAAGIEQLLSDPELASRLADAGQETAEARFSMGAMLSHYERVYTTATKRPSNFHRAQEFHG